MCRYTGVEKGMKLCTAVQEGCGYKNTLHAHRYFAPLAKYFTVCITYQPLLVPMSFLNQVLEQHFLIEITGSRGIHFTEGKMNQANAFLKCL